MRRVEVRRLRLELRRAGVDRLERALLTVRAVALGREGAELVEEPRVDRRPLVDRGRNDAAPECVEDQIVTVRGGRDEAVQELAGVLRDIRLRIDRKSTRLNSSHRCISYAVLCLQKKSAPQRRT